MKKKILAGFVRAVGKLMKNHRQPVRLAFVIVFLLVTSVLLVRPISASIGVVTKSNLQGPWQIALNGNTGCGLVSMLVTVTLNSAGMGTNATITTHGQCGNSVVTSQTFQILSMTSNGSGTANLSCGVNCGWNFNIQVSPDRSIFNLVDVDPLNPGNYLGGVAIHQ